MIRDVANFLPEKDGDCGGGRFDVDTVAFQFFDAFGNEFVVMNKRPQISDSVERELIQHQRLYKQISSQLQYNNKTHLQRLL